MARTVQGYGHDGTRVSRGIQLQSHGPCQFPGKYIAAGQAAVEFETLNQGVNRESIVQRCRYAVPRWWLFQARGTQGVACPGKRQAATPATMPWPWQVCLAGRAQVGATARQTTHQAVTWQEAVKNGFQAYTGPIPDLMPGVAFQGFVLVSTTGSA